MGVEGEASGKNGAQISLTLNKRLSPSQWMMVGWDVR
jgi:hypothetical protein